VKGARFVARCGVLGHPVSHSLSPDIFKFISRRLGREVEYFRLDVKPATLARFVADARRSGAFKGWNVTIPHKEKIARLCDELAPEARALGAVNVAEWRGKKLRGFNTDVIGIRETLKESRFRGREAVVYGSGGAALAVGYVLGELGLKRVIFQNRTLPRAKKAALRLGKIYPKTRFEASRDAGGGFQLYVNATPLGMHGFPANHLLPEDAGPRALAFDLVYRPENTSFLEEARGLGLRQVGGLDMLVWQAIGTWEIWFGRVTRKHELKEALVRHLRPS
jgi:shikimate dehydrogenase